MLIIQRDKTLNQYFTQVCEKDLANYIIISQLGIGQFEFLQTEGQDSHWCQ